MSDWVSALLIVLIIGLIVDGLRRARKARRDEIRLSKNAMKADKELNSLPEEDARSSVFPAGGARPSQHYDRASFDANDSDVVSEDHAQQDTYETTPPRSEMHQESLAFDEPEQVPMLMESVKSTEDEVTKTPLASDEREPSIGAMDDLEAVTETVEKVSEESTSMLDTRYNKALETIKTAKSKIEHSAKTLETTLESTFEKTLSPKKETPVDADGYSQNSYSQNNHTGNKTVQNDDGPREIIVINVMAKAGEVFAGGDLFDVFIEQKLRFGNMNIFHRHLDNNGDAPVIFSVANIVEPGNFNFADIRESQTPGVCIFLSLPACCEGLVAYDDMIATAQSLADGLNGELKDENRSALTKQTIEHGRQRVMELERRIKLKK